MSWTVVKDPTVLITSAVYGLLTFIVIRAGIFGLPLAALLFASIWRYCYALLRSVAQGHKHIPPPDVESFNPIGELAVFWHFIAFPGLVLATIPYQPVGMLIALFVAFVFPASAALMGLTSSMAHSFNPIAIAEFIRTIGSEYLKLVAGTLAIVLVAFVAVTRIVPAFGYFSLLPTLIVEFWGLFGCFALIGSALRAHRLDFEISGEVVPHEDRVLAQRHEDWRRDLDIAYASFRSGIVSSGYTTLHNLVAANGDSIEVNFWLVENMLEWQDKKYALEVAAKLMPRLLARGDGATALELYHRCRRRSADFRLPPEQAGQLAEFAREFGHTGVAAELRYNRSPGAGD